MFITFEGIEGCGKTTQIRLFAEKLQALGHRTILTREPGGCPISDKIRAILLDAENSKMTSSTELFLYCAARAQHIADVIKPALDEGKIVLCDRFSDATLAYQHFARGVNRQQLEILNSFAVQNITPDLTVIIDGDVDACLSRAKSRIDATSGPKEERFELESMEFHQRVRKGYQQLAVENPQRIVVVDASGTIEQLSDSIAALLLPRIEAGRRAV